MPQCVHRCRCAHRLELWPPRYWLVHLFHSHIAQLVAAACRAPLASPQVAPQCASPVVVAYFIGCLPFVFAAHRLPRLTTRRNPHRSWLWPWVKYRFVIVSKSYVHLQSDCTSCQCSGMALKYLIICLAIYCISEGTETVPQIIYKLEDYEVNRWDLLPLNAMTTQPGLTEDTFLVLKGQTVTISVYCNTSTSNWLQGVKYTRTNSVMIYARYFICKEGQCSVELQIDPIFDEMYREWTFWFYKTTGGGHMKNVKFHIRPSTVREGAVQQTVTPPTLQVSAYNVPDIYVNGALLHTQVAVSGIKDFDAFACFVYNVNISLNLTCHYIGRLPLTEISINTGGRSIAGSVVTAKVGHTSKITPEDDGTYIDCTPRYSYYYRNEMYTGDFTTLRLFLILNGSSSIRNEHLGYARIKPVSNEDQTNCLQYVNCLYDPETNNHSDLCTQTTSNISGNVSTAKKTAIIITVVVLLLVALALLIIYIYYKRKKNSRDFFINYTPQSVPNEYVTTQMSSVPRKNREPAALLSTPETEVNEHYDDEDVMLDNPIYCTSEETRNIAETNYAVIVGVIKNGKHVDFKNP
ncbi:hypothetical protein K1T71_009428 [Dendrolimus kikuchii]|uniref:Uncharacterized protein n=1 Tax=Dendrolimus kikuchii TaxID=765133 RepID=A0ACC1CVI8_9NEOP|nr:hypothetical protein K1T71_009428 [Dendrolimus kikuchii]